MTGPQHIVNISGGKDSAACYLLAIERRERTGRPFRAVTADTGHEAPETYDWIRALPDRTGGPPIEVVRPDFSEQLRRKRLRIPLAWMGVVPDADIVAAVHACTPTGNPFLDLCLWKGRFPSIARRFCTEELKHEPIWRGIYEPALAASPVIAWHGERADESPRRAKLPMWQRVRRPGMHVQTIWRPILRWSADDVFAVHRRHGLPPNPLYLAGMRRVGCFPCAFAGKQELAEISRRYPEAVERIAEMERLVRLASKRGAATFFAGDKTPEGRRLSAAGVTGGRDSSQHYPDARVVMEWAKTTRGGRQYDLMGQMDDGASCTSQYGLCE